MELFEPSAVAGEHNCSAHWLSLSQKCGTDTDTVATVHTRFKHFHEWRHATQQQGTTISINTPNELRTAWTKPRFAFPDSERARRATHVIGGTWDKRDGAPVIVQTKDIGWTPDTDPDRGDLYSVLMMRESSSKCPAGGLDVDPVNLPDGMGKCKVVMRGMTAYVEGGHGMAVLGFATKFKKVRSCRNTSAWFVVVANGLGAVFVHMALVVSFKFNSELDFMKYQQNMIEDTVASQVFAATEKGGDTQPTALSATFMVPVKDGVTVPVKDGVTSPALSLSPVGSFVKQLHDELDKGPMLPEQQSQSLLGERILQQQQEHQRSMEANNSMLQELSQLITTHKNTSVESKKNSAPARGRAPAASLLRAADMKKLTAAFEETYKRRENKREEELKTKRVLEREEQEESMKKHLKALKDSMVKTMKQELGSEHKERAS